MIKNERLPRAIQAATGSVSTMEALYHNLKVPVINVPEHKEGEEPYNDLDAALWKLDVVALKELPIYAADIVCQFEGENHFSTKPSRDPKCVELDEVTRVPRVIFDRFTRPEGIGITWHATYAIKFPNETPSVRFARLNISCKIPTLTREEIQKYYSSESSAGLLLVKLIRELHPDLDFFCQNAYDSSQVLKIDTNTAWELVVDKVPSRELLLQLLGCQTEKMIAPDESELGLVTLSFTHLLEQSPKIAFRYELKDGSAVDIAWAQEEDAQEVEALTHDNFDNAENYAYLDANARERYKMANEREMILRDWQRPDVLAALVVRNVETNSLDGYIFLTNGESTSLSGQPAAVIKRIHTKRGIVGQGLGKALLEMAEEITRHSGISVMGTLASGTADTFFERQGFKSITCGLNPVLLKSDVRARANYMEKILE